MDAKNLLLSQLQDSNKQVLLILGDLPENLLDSRLGEKSMSPRETLAHLAECCEAFQTTAGGGKHAWGTYQAPDSSHTGLLNTYRDLHAQVLTQVGESSDEGTLNLAWHYIVAHEYYHVGQMAGLRLNLDPAWDPYSLYR